MHATRNCDLCVELNISTCIMNCVYVCRLFVSLDRRAAIFNWKTGFVFSALNVDWLLSQMQRDINWLLCSWQFLLFLRVGSLAHSGQWTVHFYTCCEHAFTHATAYRAAGTERLWSYDLNYGAIGLQICLLLLLLLLWEGVPDVGDKN